MSLPSYSALSLTLAEAILLLRKIDESSGQITESMNQVAERAFEQHDAVHAIFGLGTTISDEIAAHVWMALGTTAKISEMHKAVANAEHRKVLSGIGHAKLLSTWLVTIPRIIGIRSLFCARKSKFRFRNWVV